MLITEVKKYTHYSKVTYNNNVYDVENDVLIKYDIAVGKSFNNDLFNDILKESTYSYYNRIALNRLKRMRTKNEMIVFLKEKDAPKEVVEKLITKYIKFNYINDDYYTKYYIETRQNREGPRLILRKLSEKGIEKDLINKHIENIDESEVITYYIKKRIPKIKNKTKRQVLNQMKKELVNKGYDYSLSNKLVNELIDSFSFDEKSLIEKEFNKLYSRQKSRKEGYELINYIKQSLYRKGFNKTDIDNVISTNESILK